MEALIKQFLTPSPPKRDSGFGFSDNEHSYRDCDEKPEFIENDAGCKKCRDYNSERYPSYFCYDNRTTIEEGYNHDECGYGMGEDTINSFDSPWFPYTGHNISYAHTVINHETSGYLFCNGYGIGKVGAVVDPGYVMDNEPDIIDIQVFGGSNEGINKFNGEQLYPICVIVGIEKGYYGYDPIENNVGILFDHVRGDIAMVRVVDLDFTICKGYLVKFSDQKQHARYFFGKTLHEAMKIRKDYQEKC